MATKRKLPLAPGPRSFSPFGDLPRVQRDPLGTFMADRERFGDVVRYRGGIWYAYLVTHPDDVKHVLQDNNQNYVKGFTYELLRPILGLGLLTNEGDSWLSQRRLAQPAFHRQRLVGMSAVMTDAAARVIERWQGVADGGEAIDIASEMARLTLEVVTRALLGADIGAVADDVSHAVKAAQAHVNHRVTHLFSVPEKYPTPRNRRFLREVAVLDGVVYRIIEARRGSEDTGDLLSMLRLARDEATGEGMNDKQLRDEVMTIFLAGHETTANALAWSWYLLSQNPVAEAKLHSELDSVLSGRPPGIDDLPHLPYTRMVIEESLRLYPPAWSLGRFTLDEDEVGGYRLPARSQVVLSPYVTHRHPDVWDEPESFDPERFSPERSARRARYAFFPFGGGPRQCIGSDFALTEAQIVLASLAQRFRLELVSGHLVDAEALVTLRPRHGMRMHISRRTVRRQGLDRLPASSAPV